MSSNEFEDQSARVTEGEITQESLNDGIPDTKSGVRNSKDAVMAKAKYSKGDMVHMATIANGQRVKGVFKVNATVYNPKGWVDYQLTEMVSGQLYKAGGSIREKDLKPGA